MPNLVIAVPILAAVYIATGLVLGRVASKKAFQSSGFIDHEAAAITWLWLTLFFWPAVLAVVAIFYLGSGLINVVHRIGLTDEVR